MSKKEKTISNYVTEDKTMDKTVDRKKETSVKPGMLNLVLRERCVTQFLRFKIAILCKAHNNELIEKGSIRLNLKDVIQLINKFIENCGEPRLHKSEVQLGVDNVLETTPEIMDWNGEEPWVPITAKLLLIDEMKGCD